MKVEWQTGLSDIIVKWGGSPCTQLVCFGLFIYKTDISFNRGLLCLETLMFSKDEKWIANLV